jgi:hypothetical protein
VHGPLAGDIELGPGSEKERSVPDPEDVPSCLAADRASALFPPPSGARPHLRLCDVHRVREVGVPPRTAT